nr:MAG TPA: hypothetical protein [Caudoviricetes sp.]
MGSCHRIFKQLKIIFKIFSLRSIKVYFFSDLTN